MPTRIRITTATSPISSQLSLPLRRRRRRMDGDDAGDVSRLNAPANSPSGYDDAMASLSSLITSRTRANTGNMGDRFELMFQYLKILDLEDALRSLKVIHVAGTKGKGSTCVFTESILRHCGCRTGLFTSPHLMDVRERFRLDGVEISEEKFLMYFWWCWDRLQEKTGDSVPMPTYFRFLALLSFKIFIDEHVDVAILEVGLGGKYDATNVVQSPIVCGVTSLGYDHMEILGHTLGEIAGEKAGIFKKGVPAYTVTQPDDAMSVLIDRASHLRIALEVVQPLNIESLNGQHLGLDGEHQYLNAALAVALSRTWLEKSGYSKDMYHDNGPSLPTQFVRGLAMACLEGRAQVVTDSKIGGGGLVFYLDGAHSPESMEMCARWFSHVIKDTENSGSKEELYPLHNSRQILLFNCLSVRDPQLLLPRLVHTCADHGVHFHETLFVPNQSVFNKVGTHAAPPTGPENSDLSWQDTLKRSWDSLVPIDKGRKRTDCSNTDCSNTKDPEGSRVISSIPLAIKWLREKVQQNKSIRFQVLVTGSLHLVGDVLRLLKK